MSAESTLVFYGIRYTIPVEELEQLESNTHPLILKARKAGLNFYGGNFAEPDERYFLFVGFKLGVVGVENLAEVQIDGKHLATVMHETNSKLFAGAFEGESMLYVQWMPDI